MNLIKEGKAEIEVDDTVFFNPRMEGLRDLSTCFLKSVKKSHSTLLDSTAATGIRGIRYALEAGINDITFLDINEKAYKNAKHNVERNGLDFDVHNKSIQEFANTFEGSFDIIDLDPFGTPTPYVYDIMKISRDKTILMITATDTAVLCGAHSSACIKLYNSKPIHSEIGKEAGLRILIGYIVRNAAQFNFGIETMVSLSDMHYMRTFIKLKSGAKNAIQSMNNMGFGTYCRKCHNFRYVHGVAPKLVDKCDYCGNVYEPFGPLWVGTLQDHSLLKKIRDEKGIGKMERLVGLLDDELDEPFFYSIPKLTKFLGTSSISHKSVISALKEKGYKASATQFDMNGVKTDAGIAEIIKVIKAKG